MRELGELMTEVVEADARALGPQPLDERRLLDVTSRVRRRRTVRHSLRVLVAVPLLAGAVAVASFAVPQIAEIVPALRPSPVAPAPAPAPSADAAAAAQLGLPAYLAAPEGLLQSTTAGWVLDVHRPSRAPLDDPYRGTVLANEVFAVAPDGTRYRLLSLPHDTSIDLVRWEPGAQRVLVDHGTIEEIDGERHVTGHGRAWLDLVTGTLTTEAQLTGEYLGRSAAGLDIWFLGDGIRLDAGPVITVPQSVWPVVTDTAGTRVAGDDPALGAHGGLWVADLASGEVTAVELADPDLQCRALDLSADGTFLAACRTVLEGQEDDTFRPDALVEVDRAGEAVVRRRLVPTEAPSTAAPPVRLDHGLLAFAPDMPEECADPMLVWDGSGLRPLVLPDGMQAWPVAAESWDGHLVVQVLPGCIWSASRPGTPLLRVDVATGEAVELSPVVRHPDGWIWDGLESWVVARD